MTGISQPPVPKRGRPKTASTTFFTLPGVWFASLGALFGPSANNDYYNPIFADTSMVIDQLAMFVSTSGAGNVRFGIYAADTNWQPVGAPLVDTGDVSVSSTGLKTFTPTTPVAISRGRYLTVSNTSVASVVYDCVRGYPTGVVAYRTDTLASTVVEWRVSRTYAAFPTPGTAWDTTTNSASNHEPIFLRILTP